MEQIFLNIFNNPIFGGGIAIGFIFLFFYFKNAFNTLQLKVNNLQTQIDKLEITSKEDIKEIKETLNRMFEKIDELVLRTVIGR